jgi:hypothetical protein
LVDASGTVRAPKGLRKRIESLRVRSRAAAEPKAASTIPTGYRTFSRKLAPALLATGGVLAALGALGTWVRASEVVAEGLPEEDVAAVMGHTSDWGRLLAALGVLAALGSVTWLGRRLLPKFASLLVSGAVVGIAVWRLLLIDQQAAAMAAEASAGDIDFVSFHAGFGWGSWFLVAGGISLFLGVAVGLLRELDLRKGVPG